MFSTFEYHSPATFNFSADSVKARAFAQKKSLTPVTDFHGVIDRSKVERAHYVAYLVSAGYNFAEIGATHAEERRAKRFFKREENPSLLVPYLLNIN